ncbi:MAG TPA: patatin-like phospholipase family protein, partial [Bryobacteraceae bacterium]|nr:patatin-like phospholipase family protein [Bryobacteraceae bacterium]
MYRPTLEQHLTPGHPKRILALDGGGVRGALTLSYLARIESLLRARYGDPDLRLCDYFDLIGGTSTGAIIATGLAIGKTVAELQELYRRLAIGIFHAEWYRLGLLSPKFSIEALQSALEDTFHDYQLGGSQVLTGLMIMCKRFDTGSPWVIHNHPKSRFYAGIDGSEHVPNSEYLLKHVVRASTAAPHYFEPEKIQVADNFYGAFVDGGMSPHNNPALQLLMLATLDGYCWKWPMGEANLLLISAGTGRKEISENCDDIMRMPAAGLAGRSLLNLMDDCSWLNQTVLQWIARSDTAWPVDWEIGDL